MHTVQVAVNPVVSVIVVTHNRKNDVKEAIQSIFHQSYDSIEVVVADNASNDGTCAMLEETFRNVKTLRLERNIGPSAARNVAVDNSTGQVLFFLDDDATLHRDALDRIVQRFSCEPELGVIICKILSFSSGEPEWRFSTDIAGYVDKEFYLGDLVSEGATAIRREIFQDAGGWPSDLFQYSEGRDLSYRIIENGFRMIYFPAAIAYHKKSPFLGVSRETIAHRRCFLTVRNELWIGWTYLPWRRAALETVIKLLYYPAASVHSGTFLSCLKGILAAFCGLPRTVRDRRKPVAPDTMTKMDHMLHYAVVADPRELDSAAPRSLVTLLLTKLRYLLAS